MSQVDHDKRERTKTMSLPIESYALLGDTHTAALVGTNGSIDWLCLPRFDSGACFAALVGDQYNGRWLMAPAGPVRATTRAYRDETLVLDTDFETDEGAVRVTDCMPPRHERPEVVRVVTGLRGRVAMRMELIVRFDYGAIIPWVRRLPGHLALVAGPEALALRGEVDTWGEGLTTVAEFAISAGDSVSFVLAWHPSHEQPPRPVDPAAAVADTEQWWREWSQQCTYGERDWRDRVMRSLVTLKALTYEPTGGILAAATTSLPEKIGGVRNWDYRYCWLRDATFTLYALLGAGFKQEARAWRDWLLRAVAGAPSQMQILYGPAGERRIPETDLDWLAGYKQSRPVRAGNAAANQLQLDVYGEVFDAMHQARRSGLEPHTHAWHLQETLLSALETAWHQPDEGIWEVRGGPQHFTHSKVMAWVAVDRAVKGVEQLGLDGPVDRWKRVREEIHREVCEKAYDPSRDTFTQFYGSKALDASLLRIPLVGFLPIDDPRVQGTINAVRKELTSEGFVMRYLADDQSADGLPAGEGAFLPCTSWLADCLALNGEQEEATELFEKLCAISNDVGLLSEEYDPVNGCLIGNFPQAFSHVSLVNTAANLSSGGHPLGRRYHS
jgi:GH15 family glucan-1,4-alpha-glucosidase